ncbi:hypothetical protein CcaverHIS002_0605450 [Cutaneotrichosporon cavernicola]|uniref:Amino acid permease/ SLC12A domain-containing protein n=1 Tax=Cutaneotrichosporon cavernicola TaxID=279322 RepID=A0AA48L8Y2_9TREE|nr:uncharacterized protein CcaverHIS019_0604900 [Cutaneotrichosporon cavernicola]BEI86258.1 hypothetical protein CcaverHIS002_0605450 [Cutaneotrichosporon cavernicola]BEI94031.1 hypothetical protein CcaverHIS019_0604900 [Cutaneotrichosporon cavernicola]BEJ09576.1 hypothetical protein CcaverHIS641_0604910 [Cutaneotrichosporon cavernicola]
MKDDKDTVVHAENVHAEAVEHDEKNMYDATEHLETTHEGDHGIRRDLPPRVVSMIAIAGTIGTGLFLSSGAALTTGGPVGAWIGYTAMGMAVGCMMYCLGEMMCFAPNVGAYIEMSRVYIGPAEGFAHAVNVMLQVTVGMPSEISAVAVLMTYWDDNKQHMAAYITAAILLLVAANMVGVKWYGEIEFFFAWVKVLTLLGLIIFGLIANLGGIPPKREFIGGRYWRDEPFNDDFLSLKPVSLARFLGFWAVLTRAAFSYSGIETLAALAGEAHNPRKTMKTAVRTIFYRIVGLYILSILIIGLNVSRHDPALLDAMKTGGGTAAASPFVVICHNTGVKVLPDLINGIVLTSALSCGNEVMYAQARFTMALARNGWLPKSVFLYTTRQGVPLYGVLYGAASCCLAYMACSAGSNKVFLWLSNLNALCAMVTWTLICVAYTRFFHAMRVQGVDRRKLTFRGFGQPYVAYFCIAWFTSIVLFNGFTNFIHGFKAKEFVASYITIPIVFLMWAGYKVIRRTKIIPLDRVDLSAGPAPALAGTQYDNVVVPTVSVV